ncbi:MAG: ATP-binding protein [Pseudomonadales bacterium]|nr:ATP-binding protein [Pseudomonadales bacterium]
MKLGIRSKLLLIVGVIIISVMSVHAYLQLTTQRALFEKELEKRTILMKQNLYQQAQVQVNSLSRIAAEDIASYDLLGLANKIQQAANHSDTLSYVVLVDKNNIVAIHTSRPELQQRPFLQSDTAIDIHLQPIADSVRETNQMFDEQQTDEVIYSTPITIGSEQWGTIHLAFSLRNLIDQIDSSHKENEKTLENLTLQTMTIATILFLMVYIIVSNLIRRLVAPIIHLSQKTQEVSAGNFLAVRDIEANTEDEVGDLIRNFIYMSIRLEESYQKLATYNETLENYNVTLEHRVEARTEQLNRKNKELTQALVDLEESQQQLIHSEKMAALGQLIAGIAHEINTPLGAIQASIGNSNKCLSAFIQQLPEILKSSTPEEKDFLIYLLTHSSFEKNSTTREERKLRRKLNQVLSEHDIEDSETLAELLVDMALSLDIEQLVPPLKLQNGPQIVNYAHLLTGVGRNAHTIKTAVGRASKVVFALKHYAHHETSGNMTSSNINEGIQTVLVLYHNMLKQGCHVVEHYGELPEIFCYPDELNQVWTNLIHNSLQAMKNRGTLSIETRQEPNRIVVAITDDGPGIPEEVQPHIFDTFYTTKPAGEGTGLGLGICKRIIDKHGGSISFASKPGKTSFVVTLPISGNV